MVKQAMTLRKLPILMLVASVTGLLYLVLILAVTGSNNVLHAQQLRVRACSRVEPAASRGACIEGKPAVVIVRQRRVKILYRYSPPYTVDGLIQKCIALEGQDARNLQEVIANAGNGVPNGAWGSSLASGFGQCLSGVAALVGPGNNNPAIRTK